MLVDAAVSMQPHHVYRAVTVNKVDLQLSLARKVLYSSCNAVESSSGLLRTCCSSSTLSLTSASWVSAYADPT